MDKLPGARYMNQCARMAHKIKAVLRSIDLNKRFDITNLIILASTFLIYVRMKRGMGCESY